ncbi:MAG: hypothetical protein CMM80_03345 [Rhodospirillaceae bacterium]|nr:hypothetical protein [Rhodospirillaceae bacterium]
MSPTSIRVRDAIIEKFIDKSLDELNNFLISALDTERDESKRIGILAARVYILRTRVSKIIEFNQNSMIPAVEAITPQELVDNSENSDETVINDEDLPDSADHFEEWNELMTIEAGEVNGVRIPSGVAITVGRDDAARLIETGKAKLISEEGPAEKRETEQPVTLDAPEMQEMDTESEADSSEQLPVERTEEMSTDETETELENTVEDSGVSATDTTESDGEKNLQMTSPAEDTPSSDDDDAKAETDQEFTVEDSGMSAAKTSPAHDTPPPDDNDSETDEKNTQT